MSAFIADSSRNNRIAYCSVALWKAKVNSPYISKKDTRELLSLHHPWKPSESGKYGQWECKVKSPSDWRPGMPLFVSFYQSDNYCGTSEKCLGIATQGFIGHRFKQLLVNGEVVWEQDVADDELAGDEKSVRARKLGMQQCGYPCQSGIAGYHDPYRLVDITKYAASSMALSFRLIDRVGSRTKLKGDVYQPYPWNPGDAKGIETNFQTSAYFGDIALSVDRKVVRVSADTTDKEALKREMPKPRIPKNGIELDMLSTDDLPALGYPVRCGIPFPEGMLKKRSLFSLKDRSGKIVPSALREISHWPDGTIRWVMCEFVAVRKQRYRLGIAARKLPIFDGVKVKRLQGRIEVSNKVLKLKFGAVGQKWVIEKITRSGGIECKGMYFTMKLNNVGSREEFLSVVRKVEIEEENAVCATICIEGEMQSASRRRLGPFQAHFEVWKDLPYLIGRWRVINESDQAMAMLLDWSARLTLPDLDNATVDFGDFESGFDPEDAGVKAMKHTGYLEDPRCITLHHGMEASCRQDREDHVQVLCNSTWAAKGKQAPGFANVSHPSGGVLASMRWFAEEFPKGFIVRPDMLSLATLPESPGSIGWRHDRPQARIGRGEGKTQAFALWLHSGKLSARDSQRFNACVQDPPRLFRQKWFLDSGVLGAGSARTNKALALWHKHATPQIEFTGIGAPRLGHREYWDTVWMNNYRDRIHQSLMQFLETGDPRWLRYFQAAATHNRDVDIIHFCPEHPDWVGSCHAYGEDHTSSEPMGNIGLNVDGLLEHYLMTGERESLEAARGLAEHVLQCDSWARSARAVGWPLAQVVRWYSHSGDARFLKKAKELVEAATTYIEPRRGIFNEAHGTFSYRGAVPFMTGYLAFGLIRYHQLTRDAHVLRLLHLLAEGLYAESRRSHGIFDYSPFPQINDLWVKTSKACWNAKSTLMGGLFGYLHFVSGEKVYAQRAIECYPTQKNFDQ
ncbi:MAG: hypothetical protein ABI254_06585, partial [Chthoniobacterales bacterium]